jgi:hypothetical protein
LFGITWLRKTNQQLFCQEEQSLKNYGTTVSGGTDHIGWSKVKSYGPIPTLMEEPPPEQRKHNVCLVTINDFEEILRFSSLKRLKRAMAYCLRFIYNARNSKDKKGGNLTVDETEEALLRCISRTQVSYPDELRDLQAGRPVRKSSKLLSLHPFVDKDGLIRVGGRLQFAVLDYDQRHQVILPSKCHLSIE